MTFKGQPITNLPVVENYISSLSLQSTASSNSANNGFSINAQSQRQVPSTISFDKVGNDHLYLTYRSGPDANIPNVLHVFGINPVAAQSLPYEPFSAQYLQLVTNSF